MKAIIKSLLASLRKAGYEIGKMYYEANSKTVREDDEYKKYALPDGRPNPFWIEDGVGDQYGESINDRDDFIVFDTEFFPKAHCSRDEAWAILDKYLDYGDIEEAVWKGWEDLMIEIYGQEWENKYPSV